MVRIPSLRRSETATAQDENRDGRLDERDGRLDDQATRPEGDRTRATPPVRASEPVASSSRAEQTDGRDTVVVPDRADETTTYRSRAANGPAGATAAAASDGGTRGRTATRERTDATADREDATADLTGRTPTDRLAKGRPTDDRAARDRAIDETAPQPPVADEVTTRRPATGTARPTSPPETRRDADTSDEPEIAVVPGRKPRASLLATLSLIAGVAAALFVLTGTLAGYGIALGVLAMLLAIGGVSATGRRHIAGKSDALIGLLLGLGAVVAGVLALTGQFAWPSTDADTVQRFRDWLDSQFVDRF